MKDSRNEYSDYSPELMCEEAREVMNRIPPAIIRWGSGVMAVIVGVMLAAACLIDWPETEECPCSLTPTESGDSCRISVRLTPGVTTELVKKDSLGFSISSPLIEEATAFRATVTRGNICAFHDGMPEVTVTARIPDGLRLPETGTSSLEARAIFIISERRLILHLFPFLQRIQSL